MFEFKEPVAEIPQNAVALIGIPYDENASHLRGAAAAPAQIRQALHCGSTNRCCENGTDLGGHPRFRDLGDIEPGSGGEFIRSVDQAVSHLLDRPIRMLSLGGDHSITVPIVRAYSRRFKPLNVLQIDAHPDLYDQFDGNRFSHACGFARIMEQGLASRLVQIGIRTANPHQRRQAQRFGVEMVEMRHRTDGNELKFAGPLYVSIDLDAFDPAFAPGVSHPEPGGLDTRTVIAMIQKIQAPVVGADIVELNPSRDPTGITARLAAKLLKELAAKMLETELDTQPCRL